MRKKNEKRVIGLKNIMSITLFLERDGRRGRMIKFQIYTAGLKLDQKARKIPPVFNNIYMYN